jgi:hypothetical protein
MKITTYIGLILISYSCGLKTHKEKEEQELKEKIEMQDRAIEDGKQNAQKIIDSIHNSILDSEFDLE